jgi:hypothetical protein
LPCNHAYLIANNTNGQFPTPSPPPLDESSRQSHTVDIPQSIKDALRKFRFAKRSSGSAAIVIKINKAKLIMEEVEQFDNISIEELVEGTRTVNASP